MKKKFKRVVFTGGPSAGKTSIIEILLRRYTPKVCAVPEAATILYSGGFPRIKDDIAMQHIQRAIYFTIKELEDMYASMEKAPIYLCDRGTLDGIAYWPKSAEKGFIESVGTTIEDEIKRYDVVFHLKPPRNPQFYKMTATRHENHRIALELDSKTQRAWEKHPRIYVIEDEPDFLTKVNRVVEIFEKEILKEV